jgi:DegV family protein with EDD domain
VSVRIVTDSTCDLPSEVIAEHKIAVVPLYVNFDGRSYLDGVDLGRDQFYARLSSRNPPPTTSAPGTALFTDVYQRLISDGASGIVSIHIASSLSNVFNVARVAASAIPSVPVRALDGGQITLGTGLLAVHAARLAASGATLDEIVASVETLAARTHSFAALDTLEFLRRGGRVNPVTFSVGTLLKVRPILKMHAGKVVVERARTSNGAVDHLIRLAQQLGTLESVALVHAATPERLEVLRRAVQVRLDGVPIRMVGDVAPVIGAHVGPGAVGIVCTRAPVRGSRS